MSSTPDSMDRFQWRNTPLYLKGGKSGYSGPMLFEMEDKWPEFVDKVDELDIAYEKLPILPEATPAFLGSRHFLYINEMKFRELFSDLFRDVANKENRLIRCFVDNDGGIENQALICKVVESRLMKSGQAMYVIEAEEQVRIEKLIQKPTSSYLLGYLSKVKKGPGEIDGNESICMEIFTNLKIYLRLARVHSKMVAELMKIEPPDSKMLCLSPAVLKYKPYPADITETAEDTLDRQARFASSIANLVQSTPSRMQNIFEADVHSQLQSLREMIDIASSQIKNELGQVDKYKAENEQTIRDVLEKSCSDTDEFEDLLPPLSYQELTLEGVQVEGDEELIEERVGDDLIDGEDDFDNGNVMQ